MISRLKQWIASLENKSAIRADYEKFYTDRKPDDVFLISYPRSGNTWLRHMLTLLHPAIDILEKQEITIHEAIPNIDRKPDLNTTPLPRVLKSHSLFNPLYPRVIYLLRDGRDSTSSFYKYAKQQFGYTGSFQEFIEAPLFSNYCGRWGEHVRSWIEDKHDTPLLLVRYEELRQDTYKQLKCVMDFLKWPVSSDEIQFAVNESSIENMQRKEDEGRFLANVGNGQANYGRNYSTTELELFMKYSGKSMLKCGYIDER